MAPARITGAMKHLIWASVEDQEGDGSLWLKDFDAAHNALCVLWQAHGHAELTTTQLRRYFYSTIRLNSNTKCTIYEVFAKGTILLKPSYRSVCLPAPEVQTTTDTSHDQQNETMGTENPFVSSSSPAEFKKEVEGYVAISSCSACSEAKRVCVITALDSCCQGCTMDQRKANRRKWRRILRGRNSSTGLTMGNMSPRVLAREQSIGRGLQDTTEIAHLPIDPRPLDAAQAATAETIHTHRLQSLNTLMLEDRASYLPNDEVLKQFHHETFSNISAIVDNIAGPTQSNGGRHPQFLHTIHSPQSFPLVERIFGPGITSPQGLLQKIVADQLQSIDSPIEVGTALRALFGAAVFEWVLQPGQSPSSTVPASIQAPVKTDQIGDHGSSLIGPLLFEKREYGGTLEKLLSEACPEFYDHLVLQSKYHTVKQGFEYETCATKLASHSCEVLHGFLKDNFLILDTVAHTQLREGLKNVFMSALKLKAQTCLDPTSFSFRWPRPDEGFDWTTMDVDEDGFSKSTDRIRLPLFPSLIRVDQGIHNGSTAHHDRPGAVVSRAVVLIQHELGH